MFDIICEDMKRIVCVLFCSILFVIHCYADDPDRQLIFYFDSYEHGEISFVEYLEELYLGSDCMHRTDSAFQNLIPGKTYLLKVTTNYTNVDSCFVSYNYVSESYEIDGFWIYANTGFW